MKKTWVAGLVLLGMASLRVSAGEVGIFADKLVGTTQAVNTGVQLGGQPLTAGSFNSISPTGYGVRLGYSLLNLEVLDIGVVGTYHKVSRKYLPLYVAEFQFRHNHRENVDIFDAAIAGC